MQLPRIYADFNAFQGAVEGEAFAELELTGYGTLASLAKQRIRLKEGMELLLFEPNDIECSAVAHFDASRKDPAGRIGAWVARIPTPVMIRDSTQPEEPSGEHPCIVCGGDFKEQFATRGRNYIETCLYCEASVMAPMAPPDGAA